MYDYNGNKLEKNQGYWIFNVMDTIEKIKILECNAKLYEVRIEFENGAISWIGDHDYNFFPTELDVLRYKEEELNSELNQIKERIKEISPVPDGIIHV